MRGKHATEPSLSPAEHIALLDGGDREDSAASARRRSVRQADEVSVVGDPDLRHPSTESRHLAIFFGYIGRGEDAPALGTCGEHLVGFG